MTRSTLVSNNHTSCASVLVALLMTLVSSSALARNGGLYLEVAPSWGFYSTEEVLVGDDGDDPVDYGTASFVPALKLGVNLFGWAGAEVHATGHFWEVDTREAGGAAYLGAVGRLTPLEILTYVLPETVEIPSLIPAGPVTWKNRPFDLGISFGGGYTVIGEDYAYQGPYFQWGFDIKFFITPNLSIGLDFPFRHMFYEPFRYSDYEDNKGFCTDGGKAYGYVGDIKVPVEPVERERSPYTGAEVDSGDQGRLCKDPAPSAFFFAPAITLGGVLDFGI